MTQVELMDYMTDIRDEIEDDSNGEVKSILSENENGYGCRLYVQSKNDYLITKKDIVYNIIGRIESLFEMDLDLEFISGHIVKLKNDNTRFQTFYTTWGVFFQDLVDPNVLDFMINLGKLQRRIKKFESFK
jgi:hypothetical protein